MGPKERNRISSERAKLQIKANDQLLQQQLLFSFSPLDGKFTIFIADTLIIIIIIVLFS